MDFYAVSAIFQPCNGGCPKTTSLHATTHIHETNRYKTNNRIALIQNILTFKTIFIHIQGAITPDYSRDMYGKCKLHIEIIYLVHD